VKLPFCFVPVSRHNQELCHITRRINVTVRPLMLHLENLNYVMAESPVTDKNLPGHLYVSHKRSSYRRLFEKVEWLRMPRWLFLKLNLVIILWLRGEPEQSLNAF
jgi:hypothetical protein